MSAMPDSQLDLPKSDLPSMPASQACLANSPLVDYPKLAHEIAAELVEQIGPLDIHAKKLLRMFKIINDPLPVITQDKTEAQAWAEAHATDISTFKFIDESAKEIKNSVLREYKFKAKIIYIPVFLDAAWLYFMRQASDTVIFYKLTSDELEFNLQTSIYNMPVNLANEFRKFITPGFLRDVRQETPPFLLTTDLTNAEVINRLPDVAHACKAILNLLLGMTQKNEL